MVPNATGKVYIYNYALNFQVMFQALCWHIVLISKEERYPEHYLCLLTAVLLMLSWFL